MLKNLSILICVTLVGCTTPKPLPITDFPANPQLKQYTVRPVVKKIGNNYEVTGELILNSTLLTDYYKRIETWKVNKNIR
jgi:hypothetical protein